LLHEDSDEKRIKDSDDKLMFGSAASLMQTQSILVNFGVETLKLTKSLITNSKVFKFRDLFFQMLAMILQREELELNFVRLDDNNTVLIQYKRELQG